MFDYAMDVLEEARGSLVSAENLKCGVRRQTLEDYANEIAQAKDALSEVKWRRENRQIIVGKVAQVVTSSEWALLSPLLQAEAIVRICEGEDDEDALQVQGLRGEEGASQTA